MARAPLIPLLVLLVSCARTSDDGDLRAEALMIVAAAEQTERGLTLAEVLGPVEGPVRVPPSIRVWRRGVDRSVSSCEGRVDLMELEEYVRGVLPSEWMASWSAASLDAGAVAARTYASFWVAAGGRYDCADVDDTTWTQVYRDVRDPRTDAAVSRTAGAVAVRDDSLVFAEYSAENSDPTDFGVADPVCAGRRVQGHGRGMCQWGTQRWAEQGKDAEWMIAHYYPGARVAWADEALIDGLDLTVTAGERFALELSATNPGPGTWEPGFLSVGTEPSVFVHEDWPGVERPAIYATSVAPGETVRVVWWMAAPAVEEPTTWAEFFWLDGPESERPGMSGSWNITVLPAPEVVAAPEPAPAPIGRWVAALGILALIGAMALWYRAR